MLRTSNSLSLAGSKCPSEFVLTIFLDSASVCYSFVDITQSLVVIILRTRAVNVIIGNYM